MHKDTAVLFVHGIQGQPKQFQYLMDELPEEMEVHALLLPGHGQTVREFHASRGSDWLAAVRTETQALLARGKRVVYVGHSMGCLLGLLVSRELQEPYAGMLLLCCPFRARIAGRIADHFRSLGRKQTQDPRIAAAMEGNSVPVKGFRESLLLLRPYGDLFRLMAQVRRMSPRRPEGVRFLFSERDETVNARCPSYGKRWPGAVVQVLEGCGHCYFPEAARKIIQAHLNTLIQSRDGQGSGRPTEGL